MAQNIYLPTGGGTNAAPCVAGGSMAWSTVLLALVITAGVTSDGESTFDKLQKDEEKVRESSSTKVRLARFWKHWHETHPGEKQRHQIQKSSWDTQARRRLNVGLGGSCVLGTYDCTAGLACVCGDENANARRLFGAPSASRSVSAPSCTCENYSPPPSPSLPPPIPPSPPPSPPAPPPVPPSLVHMTFEVSTTARADGGPDAVCQSTGCGVLSAGAKGNYALDLSSGGWLSVEGPFDLSGGFTVCAWLFVNSLSGAWQTAFGPWSPQTVMHFGIQDTNCLNDWSGGSHASLQYCSFTAQEWHYACSLATNNRFELWSDGVRVAQRLSGSVRSDASSTPFYIGSKHDGSNPFVGKIDEVRLYNYALSDSEMASLWANA